MTSKSVKQCVQFYYLWKKVCPDEYKRLRIVRRKKEHDELYNLRSRAAPDQAPLTGEQMSESDSSTEEEPDMVEEQPRVSVTHSAQVTFIMVSISLLFFSFSFFFRPVVFLKLL